MTHTSPLRFILTIFISCLSTLRFRAAPGHSGLFFMLVFICLHWFPPGRLSSTLSSWEIPTFHLRFSSVTALSVIMRAANSSCAVRISVTVLNALCEFAESLQQPSCGTGGVVTIIVITLILQLGNGGTERLNVLLRVTQIARNALGSERGILILDHALLTTSCQMEAATSSSCCPAPT